MELLDELAQALTKPGHDCSRADAHRLALARGLEILADENGLKAADLFAPAPVVPITSDVRPKADKRKR